MPNEQARRDRDGQNPLDPTGSASEISAQRLGHTLQLTAANDGRPRKPRTSDRSEHAVFLVPGLLGLEGPSSFRVFADRVVAALRATLEQHFQAPVPVIALPIPPTASLRERQHKLVKALADCVDALERGRPRMTLHVVGHSTGGLDANLLTHKHPVAEASWSDLDHRAPRLRERIRSVVSIASPLQGACISRDAVAGLLTRGNLRGLSGLASLVGRVVSSTVSEIELRDLLRSASREGHRSLRILKQLARDWSLLPDLDPSFAIDPDLLDQHVSRRSFVCLSGRPMRGETSVTPADSLFRELSRRAAGFSSGCTQEGELITASVARINRALGASSAASMLIRAPEVECPDPIDAGHNDGVVNSARQLLDPTRADELAGIVVGDHFDVAGYYDRKVCTIDEAGREQTSRVESGLLHSGSGFGDDQFFELYRRVAGVIAAAAT